MFICNLYDLSEAITKIVNRLIAYGCANTTSGNYIFDYGDVSDLMIKEEYLEYLPFIEYELAIREEVLDVDVVGGNIDINFGLARCPMYEPLPGEDDSEYGTRTPAEVLSMARLAELGSKAIREGYINGRDY